MPEEQDAINGDQQHEGELGDGGGCGGEEAEAEAPGSRFFQVAPEGARGGQQAKGSGHVGGDHRTVGEHGRGPGAEREGEAGPP